MVSVSRDGGQCHAAAAIWWPSSARAVLVTTKHKIVKVILEVVIFGSSCMNVSLRLGFDCPEVQIASGLEPVSRLKHPGHDGHRGDQESYRHAQA